MAELQHEALLDRIAESDARFIRVIGGAGTGKTLAVVRRLERLLRDGTSPDDVLVLAATRSAADALRGRIARSEVPGAEDVRVCTPAAYFVEVLASDHARATTGRVPRLLSDFEERILMEDMKVVGLKVKRLREMLRFFYRQWTELADDGDGFLVEDDERAVHETIKGHVTMRGAMLAPELSNVTFRYLSAHPGEARAWRKAHVLVDDYQNLNKASQATLDLLATKSLTVCGNVNELVPTAEPYPHAQGLLSFVDEHEEAESFTLKRGLRCPQRVCAMANSLVACGGMDEDVLVELDEDAPAGDVRIVRWTTPGDEFAGITRYLKHRLADEADPLRPRDVFIAVPNALWGRALAKMLNVNGVKTDQFVSYHALKGDPRDEKKCASLRAYVALNLAADPCDAVAWRGWCGFGDYLTHSNHWCRLEEFAAERGTGVVEALGSLGSFDEPPFAGADVLLDRYREGGALIASVGGKRGFSLLEGCAGSAELPADVRSLLEPLMGTESASELFARAQGRLENAFADVDAVRIGLPQMACGLAFDVVVLAGAVDGFVPRAEAFSMEYDEDRRADMMAEDRRCWYAALTKAAKTLVVSCFQKDQAEKAVSLGMQVSRIRKEGDAAMATVPPSRFIAELGGEAPGFVAGM